MCAHTHGSRSLPGSKCVFVKRATPSPSPRHDVSRALIVWFSSVFFSLLPFRHFLTIDLFNDAVPKPKQYSQNKDHEHHKWRPQKSWISFRGYTVAQVKQLTQYLLTLMLKWKMLQNFWRFQNRNVQTYGYVYHETKSLNHGPNQIAVHPEQNLQKSSFSRTVVGKAIWESSMGARLGENSLLGMPIRAPWERIYSHLCMWMTSNWLQRNKILIRCGKYSIKKLIWENQHQPLIMFTWVALRDNVKKKKKQRYGWPSQNHVRIQYFRKSLGKIPSSEAVSISTRSLRCGRSCSKMCGKILRVGEQKLLIKCTKCYLHALTTTNSKKKNWNPWEN